MSSSPKTGPLRIGDVFLGRYHILDVMGRGGFGCVYRARNEFMGREFALKVLDDRQRSSKEAIQRGRQEAVILGQLDHPNIVRVYDADVTQSGQLYIAMELLKGQPLNDHLQENGPVDVDRGLSILEALCDALGFAHEKGISHRDIKPANIFITEDGTPKLLDFGIAKVAGNTGFNTAPNLVVGTSLYISPEQVHACYDHLPQKPAPELSDIYALGLVAFQMFQGQHPLMVKVPNADFRNHHVVWRLHVQTELPLLHEVVPGFPKAVSLLINTALAKQPDDRIRTMGEFATKAKTARLKQLAVSGGAHYTPIPNQQSSAPTEPDSAGASGTQPLARRGTKKLFNEADAPTVYVESAETQVEGSKEQRARAASPEAPAAIQKKPSVRNKVADTLETLSRTLTVPGKALAQSPVYPRALIGGAVAVGLIIALMVGPRVRAALKKDSPPEFVIEETTPLPPAEEKEAEQAAPEPTVPSPEPPRTEPEANEPPAPEKTAAPSPPPPLNPPPSSKPPTKTADRKPRDPATFTMDTTRKTTPNPKPAPAPNETEGKWDEDLTSGAWLE